MRELTSCFLYTSICLSCVLFIMAYCKDISFQLIAIFSFAHIFMAIIFAIVTMIKGY